MDREQTIDELVRDLYAALQHRDADRLRELLADDFECSFAEGMPLGIGGRLHGAEAMIERGWWALGRAFKVGIGPSDWIPCAGGRLLVIGRYEGAARSTEKRFTAKFAHLWDARDGRLASLWHLTDTVAWTAALEP